MNPTQSAGDDLLDKMAEQHKLTLEAWSALRVALETVKDHSHDCGCGAYEVAQEALAR